MENGGKREVVLRPGELAETVGTQIRVTQVNVRKYTAWREGVFYFEEAELEEIMTELADWYCVQAVLPIRRSGRVNSAEYWSGARP